MCTADCVNLKLKLDGDETLDGIFKAEDFVDFVGFETSDGVEFSNLLSDGIKNVIKIEAERRLTTLTIAAVIFGLLSLCPDQEGKTHRQNQLRERKKLFSTYNVCLF